MKAFTRIVGLLALIAVLLPVAAGASAAPLGRGASPAPSFLSGCQLAPSDANCTNQDPQVMGCEADAYTLSQAEAYGYVRVAVRYSPTCRSAWARAVNLSNLYGSRVTAQILRNDGYGAARVATYPTTAVVSPMVFLGGSSTAQGIGTLQNSYGQIISQVRTGFVR